jgi:hypothetical protein
MEARWHQLPTSDEGGTTLLGPLPRLHRLVLVAISICSGVLAGAWIAHATPLPVAVSMGALAGGLLGPLVAYALVHTSPAEPRPIRVTRRR